MFFKKPTHILRSPTLGLELTESELFGVLYMQSIEWSQGYDGSMSLPNGSTHFVNNSFDPGGECLLELKYLLARRDRSGGPGKLVLLS